MGWVEATSHRISSFREHSPEARLGALLADTINAIEGDPAQLRNVGYELARIKLQRECLLAYPRLTVLEARRVLLAFETAVERLETALSEGKSSAEVNGDAFAAILVHTVERMEHDPDQLRGAVCELARIKLERECLRNQLTLAETTRVFSALEAASQRIESSPPTIEHIDVPPIVPRLEGPLVVGPDDRIATLPSAVPRDAARSIKVRMRGRFHTRAWVRSGIVPLMKACILVALAVVAFLVLSRTLQPPQVELVESKATSPVGSITLPTRYGVYAVAGGQVRELEALPGQVSEHRIVMTMKPSRTIFPNGPLSFIIYRPDMALGAPEQVEVRAFAQTRPSVWTIGKVVRPLSAASLIGAPEMVQIGPEILDSGRYVLVIKGQPYDFAVRE